MEEVASMEATSSMKEASSVEEAASVDWLLEAAAKERSGKI